MRVQTLADLGNNVPYSRKYWRGIKFGSLAVYMYITTAKLKPAKISYSHIIIICMAIPYGITKFKSANILAIVILGSTAKFNSHQYIQYLILEIFVGKIFCKNWALISQM